MRVGKVLEQAEFAGLAKRPALRSAHSLPHLTQIMAMAGRKAA